MIILAAITAALIGLFLCTSECRYCRRPLLGRSKLCGFCALNIKLDQARDRMRQRGIQA